MHEKSVAFIFENSQMGYLALLVLTALLTGMYVMQKQQI